MSEWKTIETAPRGGEYVELAHICGHDDEETYVMRWNPEKTNGLTPFLVGMWEMEGGHAVWSEGEGGPTHWRHLTIN